MRISDLSHETGIPVATIKYYLREQLLRPGTTTARNQARYEQFHVERLHLIRALREGGGLSIATLARVLAVMDSQKPHDRPIFLTLAVRALSDPTDESDTDTPNHELARRHVDDLLDELEWDTNADSPGHDDLVRAVAAIHRFLPGLIGRGDQLRPYAHAMRGLADIEITDTFNPDTDPHGTLRLAVLGTVLFEPVILALRKLAHVDRLRTLAQPPAVISQRGEPS